MSSDLLFAEFIDETQRQYTRSPAFRSALHGEAPGAPTRITGICPLEHRHAETGTCYRHHGCRCEPCRLRENRYQKRERMKKAVAGWNRMNRKAS